MNILLIEDNENNRYLARFLLEAHGHQVREASDGLQGVAAAQAEVPDLILLDIQLPQMDGYAVAHALRQDPALDAVPIIAVTSYAMNGDRVRALDSGCDNYIEKPIDTETFVARIQEAAAAGRSGRKGTS
jgi:two-component system cell cycle response regulator DivK